MKRRPAAAIGLVALAGLLSNCKVQQGYPGAEVLVTVAFEATATSNDCNFTDGQDDIPDASGCAPGSPSAFCFSGTYSRDPGSGSVYFTINGRSWPATFDGQFASVEMNAPRRFAECQPPDASAGLCDTALVVEDLTVAMLSGDQSRAVGNQCPANPLDGGLPADAGKPQETEGGLDVLLACGELSDAVLPDAGCGCHACAYHYRLSGLRR